MKIVETSGCTAAGLEVDGYDFYSLKKEIQKEIINSILLKLKDAVNEGEIHITNVINLFSYEDFECDDEPCDQCGDTVTTTTWNI